MPRQLFALATALSLTAACEKDDGSGSDKQPEATPTPSASPGSNSDERYTIEETIDLPGSAYVAVGSETYYLIGQAQETGADLGKGVEAGYGAFFASYALETKAANWTEFVEPYNKNNSGVGIEVGPDGNAYWIKRYYDTTGLNPTFKNLVGSHGADGVQRWELSIPQDAQRIKVTSRGVDLLRDRGYFRYDLDGNKTDEIDNAVGGVDWFPQDWDYLANGNLCSVGQNSARDATVASCADGSDLVWVKTLDADNEAAGMRVAALPDNVLDVLRNDVASGKLLVTFFGSDGAEISEISTEIDVTSFAHMVARSESNRLYVVAEGKGCSSPLQVSVAQFTNNALDHETCLEDVLGAPLSVKWHEETGTLWITTAGLKLYVLRPNT